ncbi:MAG: DNA alkylation repair protein [Parachlamydiaceae bacterium]
MFNKINQNIDKEIFLKKLQELADLNRASVDQRYHKSSRVHWGVSVPACDQLVKTLCKKMSEQELMTLVQNLWNTNIFDAMVCAAKILCFPTLQPSKELWNTIKNFLNQVDGWALEDHLSHVAWKCILADNSLLDEVEEWTQHSSFWMRRAALVYTLPFAKPGQNPERMLGWASRYASDSEWFIQKSIGWWLRVLGEHNPQRVVIFLNLHWSMLKSVARKEATRKLSAQWQNKIELTSEPHLTHQEREVSGI